MRTKRWAKPELDACPFFYDCNDSSRAKRGCWQQAFAKKQPLHLDLGCGKCVFLAKTALAHPEFNYIGVDINYSIFGVARRNIVKLFGRDPENVGLLFYNIERLEEVLDSSDGIERIYVNFCNPWPRLKHHKRRLTHPRQLAAYKKLLTPEGELWFKTDNDDLFADTVTYLTESGFTILEQTEDLHAHGFSEEYVSSEHEDMFSAQGIRIKALRAKVGA